MSTPASLCKATLERYQARTVLVSWCELLNTGEMEEFLLTRHMAAYSSSEDLSVVPFPNCLDDLSLVSCQKNLDDLSWLSCQQVHMTYQGCLV